MCLSSRTLSFGPTSMVSRLSSSAIRSRSELKDSALPLVSLGPSPLGAAPSFPHATESVTPGEWKTPSARSGCLRPLLTLCVPGFWGDGLDVVLGRGRILARLARPSTPCGLSPAPVVALGRFNVVRPLKITSLAGKRNTVPMPAMYRPNYLERTGTGTVHAPSLAWGVEEVNYQTC